jgi:CheY-like chemotaxis protein
MKRRILIVDDDTTITQQLYWTLCDEYDVVTANDMQTAIRRATFYKPDISILDLQMPPERDTPATGMRLLEFIKRHARQHLPLDACAPIGAFCTDSLIDPDVSHRCVRTTPEDELPLHQKVCSKDPRIVSHDDAGVIFYNHKRHIRHKRHKKTSTDGSFISS